MAPVNPCAQCGADRGSSPSAYFCSELCGITWHSKQAIMSTRHELAGDLLRLVERTQQLCTNEVGAPLPIMVGDTTTEVSWLFTGQTCGGSLAYLEIDSERTPRFLSRWGRATRFLGRR